MTHQQPFSVPARPLAKPANSAELALSLLGPSAAMSQLWAQMRRLAPHVRSLLLTGEANCGQQAVARLLLDLSLLPHRPFIELSAAEAELHLTRNTPFSSHPAEPFLFLPDVHLLSAAAQEGLLRLMRARRARPLAVIAATGEDLRGMVSTGRFSPELADALTGVRLLLPPLRKRPEDLPMLLGHMLAARATSSEKGTPALSEDLLRAAMEHPWPGNLAELSDAVDRLLAEADGAELGASHFHAAIAAEPVASRNVEPAPVRMVPLDKVVQEHIVAVLQGCRGNKLRAAEVLGISRSTLYRMLDASGPEIPLSIAS